MARFVFHPGFHKTGTTSIQNMLRANRAALKPYARIVMRPGMLALCEAARAWSVSRSEADLGLVKFEAAALAEAMSDEPSVIFSSEDLAGHMPGRRGLTSYDAVPRLMKAIDYAFRAAVPDAETVFFFTTRAPEPWLVSCHAQHLRATRMRLGADEYAEKFRSSANFKPIIDKVAQVVPQAQVEFCALDYCAGRLGPMEPLLLSAGVPETLWPSLSPMPPANTAPTPERIAALLEINRSDMSDPEARDARRALSKGKPKAVQNDA